MEKTQWQTTLPMTERGSVTSVYEEVSPSAGQRKTSVAICRVVYVTIFVRIWNIAFRALASWKFWMAYTLPDRHTNHAYLVNEISKQYPRKCHPTKNVHLQRWSLDVTTVHPSTLRGAFVIIIIAFHSAVLSCPVHSHYHTHSSTATCRKLSIWIAKKNNTLKMPT